MLDIRRLKDPFVALGVALHFLGRREPFARFKAEQLVATVDGQVRREHYLLAFDGRRVAGYLGWALLDEAAAERFARTGEAPSNEDAASGDILWLLTVAATDRAVLAALVRVGRRLHPGRRILGVRHRADGRASLLRCANRRGSADQPGPGLRAA